MRYSILLLAALACLGACSNNPTPSTDATSADEPGTVQSSARGDKTVAEIEPSAGNEPSAGEEPSATVGETEPSADTTLSKPVRPIPEDSLYPLLVAEFALRRRNYDLALKNYQAQSNLLRDRGVSAHTTRLAQFMQRDEEAIAAAELWVELEPDSLEARLSLANLLSRNGRTREALPHMVVIVEAGGNANFSSLATGFGKLDVSAQEAFLEDIRHLQAAYPQDTQLMICAALLLEQMEQTEAAVNELQPVFELDPDQLQAVVLEAKLKQDLGRGDGIYDRISAALEKHPDNTRLRLQYARLLTRTDMAEAGRQFELLLQQSPRDPDLLFSLALIQREMNDLDGARDKLRQLLTLKVRTNDAHFYLGKIAEQQTRFQDALRHYMSIKPGRDFPAATNRIAVLLIAGGKTAELQEYFNHLRNQYPTLLEQLYAIEVDNLINADQDQLALEQLNAALQARPESVPLLYTRSMLGEKTGDMALMESDLRTILVSDPDNSTALNALGYTLANKTDRFTEAEELIARALQLQPNEPAILDSMGWVKYRLGEYDQAVDYLRQAYAVFPDPEVAAHLGEALWAMGDTDAALTVWNTALSASPEHKVLLETMLRLGADPAAE
jgi:tetratricopeptide (TPR) repeat protein